MEVKVLQNVSVLLFQERKFTVAVLSMMLCAAFMVTVAFSKPVSESHYLCNCKAILREQMLLTLLVL